MANVFRSAKSGSDWSENELLAYNITVQRQSAIDFFGRELNLASRPNAGQESAIDDLAKSILEVTDFDEPGTILRTHYDIPYAICGDRRAARADISLVHLSSVILLVVQEDKTTINPAEADPEPQVIAGAIATFQHNNRKRAFLDLPTLDMMTIPCITMVGTRPFFYQVPVTSQLSNSVITGQYPLQPTFVRYCAPPSRRRASEGMELPDYRCISLQYYNAFRDLAKTSWTKFIDGWY
ncbi:hypothetical protein BJV78DRAFT_1177683 [Lactifluus subvellereus]|nr:hypothetical protein BJV78DRAFT_1177683 [Lactifluus subvellereus]